jgi:hypothetical protein
MPKEIRQNRFTTIFYQQKYPPKMKHKNQSINKTSMNQAQAKYRTIGRQIDLLL